MAREVWEGRLDLAFIAARRTTRRAPSSRRWPVSQSCPLRRPGIRSPRAPRSNWRRSRTEAWSTPAGWGIRMAVDRSFAAAGVTRTISYEVNDTAATGN